jgi:hypothetical protein
MDIEGVIIRQSPNLHWSYIRDQLAPLAELKDAPELMSRLERTRERCADWGGLEISRPPICRHVVLDTAAAIRAAECDARLKQRHGVTRRQRRSCHGDRNRHQRSTATDEIVDGCSKMRW